MGAEVAAKIAAAQFSAAQAAASAAQAAASAAHAAASVVQAAASADQVAAQASATVADQDAATVGADEAVNESAGIRFWNKTKACLGHAIHLWGMCIGVVTGVFHVGYGGTTPAALGRVELKRIENKINRQVTFAKSRNGLLKKAYEVSVLCDAEVALLVFSNRGKLYEFCSTNK
ncbi:hypothetical protein H5410_039217 [Solanum commersonii]|uniref:MADS-box domain-containing protein n=1 Tax=Solanum commersonii TaxID=4109 RepID=A0A9J5YCE9_SOLCO|nr:hypothetical protein H5410_039217 [Solanum commersonii]